MARAGKKFFAFVLCLLLLLSNSIFAYALETNIWAERKKSVQFASLSSLPELPKLTWQSSLDAFSSPDLKDLRSPAALLRSIPAAYGNVRRLQTSHGRATGRTVIHIQDVHQNPEAQKNIARVISVLAEKGQIDLIALEGAFVPVDLSPFRAFPGRDTIEDVAATLLENKKISGPTYSAFTGNRTFPPVVGIDDAKHYRANVDAVRQSAPLITSYQKQLNETRGQWAAQGTKILGPALAAFDQKVQAHRRGTLSLGAYLAFLTQQAATTPASVRMFMEASQIEVSLNFQAVESERTDLLAHLLKKCDKQQTAAFINASIAFRLNTLSHVDFYRQLQSLCEKRGLSLSRYPHFNTYLAYIQLANAIDAEILFGETQKLENAAYQSLIKTPEERTWVAGSKRLYLTGKLLDFSLTKEEWKEYKEYSSLPLAPSIGKTWRGDNLIPFENFYREAEARDALMAENLLKAMKDTKAKTVVLVTGGFHSARINEILSRSGATTLTFVPRITRLRSSETNSGGPAPDTVLSVFAQDKTPLEKLFGGEILFLAPVIETRASRTEWALLSTCAGAMRGQVGNLAETFKNFLGRITGVSLRVKNVTPTAVVGELTQADATVEFNVTADHRHLRATYAVPASPASILRLSQFRARLKATWDHRGDIWRSVKQEGLRILSPRFAIGEHEIGDGKTRQLWTNYLLLVSTLAMFLVLPPVLLSKLGSVSFFAALPLNTLLFVLFMGPTVDIAHFGINMVSSAFGRRLMHKPPSPNVVAAHETLMPNSYLSIGVMDKGAEVVNDETDIGKKRVIYRNSLQKIMAGIRHFFALGFNHDYLYGGLFEMGSIGQQLHTLANGERRLIKAKDAAVYVAVAYETRHVERLNGLLIIKDDNGNPFAPTDMKTLNTALSDGDVAQDLDNLIAEADQYGIEIISDYIHWRDPGVAVKNIDKYFHRDVEPKELEQFREALKKSEGQEHPVDLFNAINNLLAKDEACAIALIEREGELIPVRVLHLVGAPNKDQIIPNLFRDDVNVEVMDIFKGLIDRGIKGVRIDLFRKLTRDEMTLTRSGSDAGWDYEESVEPIGAILRHVKQYAKAKGLDFTVIIEAYQGDVSFFLEGWRDVVDVIYYKDQLDLYEAGKIREMAEALGWAISQAGRLLVFASNFDEPTLKLVGDGKNPTGYMGLLFFLARTGMALMVDFVDLIFQTGRLIPIPGPAHPVPTDGEIEDLMNLSTEQLLDKSPVVQILKKLPPLDPTVPAQIINNKNQDRYIAARAKTRDGNWAIAVVDFEAERNQPEDTLWVALPEEIRIEMGLSPPYQWDGTEDERIAYAKEHWEADDHMTDEASHLDLWVDKNDGGTPYRLNFHLTGGAKIHVFKIQRNGLAGKTGMDLWQYGAILQRLYIRASRLFVKAFDGISEIWASSVEKFQQQWGRDAFISLPGLLLATGKFKEARNVIESFAGLEKNGLIPNRIWDRNNPQAIEYNTADGSMWFIQAVKKYVEVTGDTAFAEKMLPTIRNIVRGYENGTGYDDSHHISDDPSKNSQRIFMADDGLIVCPPGSTWMDAMLPSYGFVTPRHGKPVEIQALWYANLRFMAELAGRSSAQENQGEHHHYAQLADRVKESFNNKFWNEQEHALFDVVDTDYILAGAIRPNMLVAISHGGDLLSPERQRQVFENAKRNLITPYGPRTLDPRTVPGEADKGKPPFHYYYPHYYTESTPKPEDGWDHFQWHKDFASHQGPVRPSLMGIYTDALVRVRVQERKTKDEIKNEIRELLLPLTEDLLRDGTLHEVYDAEPRPDGRRHPGGTSSQAQSVAEVLRVLMEYEIFPPVQAPQVHPEFQESRGGLWPWAAGLYDAIGGWKGRVLAPVLLESLLFVGGGTWAAAWLLDLPLSLSPPVAGIFLLFKTAWLLFHGRDLRHNETPRVITILTLAGFAFLYACQPQGGFLIGFFLANILLPHAALNHQDLKTRETLNVAAHALIDMAHLSETMPEAQMRDVINRFFLGESLNLKVSELEPTLRQGDVMPDEMGQAMRHRDFPAVLKAAVQGKMVHPISFNKSFELAQLLYTFHPGDKTGVATPALNSGRDVVIPVENLRENIGKIIRIIEKERFASVTLLLPDETDRDFFNSMKETWRAQIETEADVRVSLAAHRRSGDLVDQTRFFAGRLKDNLPPNLKTNFSNLLVVLFDGMTLEDVDGASSQDLQQIKIMMLDVALKAVTLTLQDWNRIKIVAEILSRQA